jgi:hypothetical protein
VGVLSEGMSRESLEQATARYLAATHATQSGVDMLMNFDEAENALGHLRLGTNSAMASCSAPGRLLIDRGFITEAQYFGLLADVMEAERDIYAGALMEYTGTDVTLT